MVHAAEDILGVKFLQAGPIDAANREDPRPISPLALATTDAPGGRAWPSSRHGWRDQHVQRIRIRPEVRNRPASNLGRGTSVRIGAKPSPPRLPPLRPSRGWQPLREGLHLLDFLDGPKARRVHIGPGHDRCLACGPGPRPPPGDGRQSRPRVPGRRAESLDDGSDRMMSATRWPPRPPQCGPPAGRCRGPSGRRSSGAPGIERLDGGSKAYAAR